MAFDIAAAIMAAQRILGDTDPETGSPVQRRAEAKEVLDTLGTSLVPELRLDPVITYFISRWQRETGSDTNRERPLLHLLLVLVAVRLAQATDMLAPGGSAANPDALALLPDVSQQNLEGTTPLNFLFRKVNDIHEAILMVAPPARVGARDVPRPEIERLLRGLHGACEGPLGGVWP